MSAALSAGYFFAALLTLAIMLFKQADDIDSVPDAAFVLVMSFLASCAWPLTLLAWLYYRASQ